MNNIALLKKLLKQVKYSEVIYREAANKVHSGAMQQKLAGIAAQRAQFADEMMRIMAEEGEKPDHTVDQPYIMDKTWLSINDLFIHRNVPYIIQSCIKTDQPLVNNYRQLMDAADVQTNVKKMTAVHYKHIKGQILQFREALREYTWA